MGGHLPDSISPSTRICAVLGHPIAHSASPAMHNAGFAELGLNWRYLAFDVHPDQLQEALRGAQVMKMAGLNLTVPHKIFALEMVDVVEESTRGWGAVNTISFEGKQEGFWVPLAQLTGEPEAVRSHGYNTDADAIVRSLQEDLKFGISGAKILVLGAGGAGRVAALKLAAEGCAEIYLVNRTEEKAEQVAAEILRRHPSVVVKVGYPVSSIDLVLNATSAGLKESDPLPFDPSSWDIKKSALAYDMIYKPSQTGFLRAAAAAGCRTSNGVGMLLHQGAAAFEIWTGKKAPLEVMRRALQRAIYG